MPSTAYFAELNPDPFLRRCVAVSGIVLMLAGIAAIATLPVSAGVHVGVGLAWCLLAGRELWRLRNAWRDCRALRVAIDGDIRVLNAAGEWARARLLPGSVLLRHWAWIRVGRDDQAAFGEFLRGSCRKCNDWRRLQVIWRHVGDRG